MIIHRLPNQFVGKGEVGGFNFEKEKETDESYCYKVSSEGVVWYETFDKKVVPLCIDFSKKIFSDIEFKEKYPRSKDFGVWAWTKKI